MTTFVKKSALKSVLAGAALFLHATSVSNEAVSLTIKTYDGFKHETAEGTWVNDLQACFKRKSDNVQYRIREEDPGIIRTLVNTVCPPVVS